MAETGPVLINLEDFIGFFEQNSPEPDDEDKPYILDYKTERIQGIPNAQKLDEGSFEFSCVITTKRLLKHAVGVQNIHADSTYKLNWMGYPVHIFGTSDLDKKFHLIAIAFSTRENKEQFEYCFEAIRAGVVEVFGQEPEFMALMSDGAAAIKAAFEAVYPFAVKLTCWFHVEESLRKRKFQLARNKEPLLKDIRKLALCPNIKIFDIASELLITKWIKNGETEFTTYLKGQWLTPANKYWFAGAKNFTPSTNNCLESFNGKIKNNFNFRERSKMNVFKVKILQLARVISAEYRDGIKTISGEVTIKKKLWQTAYEWAKSDKGVIEEDNLHYVPSGSENRISRANLTAYKGHTWKTFEQWSKNIFQLWVTMIPPDPAHFKMSTCTCPSFLKDYICKHILGLGLRLQKIQMPDDVKPLETKPIKRGRPKRTGGALSLE